MNRNASYSWDNLFTTQVTWEKKPKSTSRKWRERECQNSQSLLVLLLLESTSIFTTNHWVMKMEFTHFYSQYSEKAMAPHSSTCAWKLPWTEEPGRLQSMGSWRVGHDWVTSLSIFTFMHWRRKWQRTPVFLPGESQGPWSLVGCRLWGHTELDTTKAT